MTRNFRDEWEASAHADDQPVASAEVQQQIAALLRTEASRDAPRMPDDVATRVRDALTSASREAGVPSDERLSDVRRPPEDLQRDEHPRVPPAVPLPRRPGAQQRPAAPASEGQMNPPAASQSPSGATVTSLDGHRRRRTLGRAALALGAAAAVAIGAVTLVTNRDESHPSAQPTAGASMEPAEENYASRVRVTQTQTKYTSTDLATQAAALRTSKSPAIEPAQANAQSLGPLATGEGVQACLQAVAKGVIEKPDAVYADFATYDGTPAVIVVAVKGRTSTAWVVSRTCSTATDLEAGPTSVTT